MEGLIDIKDLDKLIKISNGIAMRACKTEHLKCEVTQLDRRKFVVTLNNVNCVPEICSNLFSLNKALRNGLKLSNDDVIVSLMKKHVTLTFDRIIKTLDDGCVTGAMVRTISAKQGYDGFAHDSIEKEKSLDINHLQRVFGHCGMETLKNTVKMNGLKYWVDFETCEEYAGAKAQQKDANKNGQAEAIFQVKNSTLISVPLRKVALEEPSFGPSLLMLALTTAGAL
jgi:hypothetical protein